MLRDDEIGQMNKIKGLSRLLKDIYATDIREIQCNKAMEKTVNSVYASLSEEQSRQQYPYLWLHFRFCPHCRQEYQMLRDLVEMEKSGQLEYPTHIPPPPDQGKPARWPFPKNVIPLLFPGFSFALSKPAAASRARDREFHPVRRHARRREFEPVDVSLAQQSTSLSSPAVQIEFDLAAKGDETQLYELSCAIKPTDEALKDNVDGALAWLQLGDEGPAIQEKALNDFGYVTFTDLQAGQYALRFQLAKQTYGVTGIVLPQS